MLYIHPMDVTLIFDVSRLKAIAITRGRYMFLLKTTGRRLREMGMGISIAPLEVVLAT